MLILFSYLYRDAGNYKQWFERVFSNPLNYSLVEVERKITSVLIDGLNFPFEVIAQSHPNELDYDCGLDHGWFEFSNVALVDEVPNGEVVDSIDDFLLLLEEACCKVRGVLG